MTPAVFDNVKLPKRCINIIYEMIKNQTAHIDSLITTDSTQDQEKYIIYEKFKDMKENHY